MFWDFKNDLELISIVQEKLPIKFEFNFKALKFSD